MGHSVTLGGDRVGSGSKNKMYLHNYERSTHDLSQKFTSSMGVGMLIPFLVIPATRGDKFEIDLNAGLRTIPTKGPLFGSFKLQVDVYECPSRLYQALLHNNPLAIGLKANQVKFPKMRLYGTPEVAEDAEYGSMPSATNSLVKYLGVSGIGSAPYGDEVQRDFNAIPILAYYDIFKNYYANKQEEKAYTLGSGSEKTAEKKLLYKNAFFVGSGTISAINTNIATNTVVITIGTIINANGFVIQIYKNNNIELEDWAKNTRLLISWGTVEKNDSIKNLSEEYGFFYGEDNENYWVSMPTTNSGQQLTEVEMSLTDIYTDTVVLKPFPLENIDKMRMDILSFHQLGQSFMLDGAETLDAPYWDAIGENGEFNWQKQLSGLCVKTYQSDLFNNWINTEWIDGENGIAAITAISTSEGKITIDAINFSEKLYNLLNRIAISGATYEDYLNAAYTDSAKKFCEAPLWIGGMSDEIVFEEIVQTAPADGDPLGTLGGRGNLLGKKKGGKITVKVDEPSFIIGIVSITPRVDYTQGNEWYMTELDNLQDLHVPALDAIGFQNLIAERMHYGTTIFEDGEIQERPVIGKIPAWLEYMTAVNKAYGDFAETDGKGYMILNRDYNVQNGELLDATTYIDPQKYNYAFAYTMRDAQNFWVQIHSNIIARRLMSARQIPNL